MTDTTHQSVFTNCMWKGDKGSKTKSRDKITSASSFPRFVSDFFFVFNLFYKHRNAEILSHICIHLQSHLKVFLYFHTYGIKQ